MRRDAERSKRKIAGGMIKWDERVEEKGRGKAAI